MESMVQAFKAKVNGVQYMFGVEISRNVKHALAMDKANRNNLWQESINKELQMINQFQTFWRLNKGETLTPDYKRVPYFIVFANKFDGQRKARLIANGSQTVINSEDVYSGVVGMETVRLGFLLAEMNGHKVCVADKSSAYLYSKTREWQYIVAGLEFRELEGERLIIDKGLYELCMSSARFHEHLACKLRKMGYLPSKADSNFWIKRHEAGHYEYIANYIDDVISFSKDPMSVIDELKLNYMLKGVGEPEYYLEGSVDPLDET
jgi:Reverse transcriptase (RNA-dependent DNA polymerase)